MIMTNIIYSTDSILDALRLLQHTAKDLQSLFVVDNTNRMVGTLSDGDIRRGLISGAQLTDCVSKVMHTDFKFIKYGECDVRVIKAFRENRIFLLPILDNNGRIVDIINLRTFYSCLPIDAVLMAGGKGERLRPLTVTIPKPLLPIGDKAIIDYNIDRLISYGVKHVNVTVNYLKEKLEEHFAEPHNGIQIRTLSEPKFLGTIGSIKFVEKFYNDTVLLMNSDVFTNIDFEDFFLHFQQHDAEMSVAAIPYNISIPFGILDLDGRDIKGILEKPEYNYYANAGIYMMKRRAINEIPEDTFFHATHLVEKLISQGKKVIRYPLNGTWIDIGAPQEYERAKDLIKHLK